MKESNVKLSIDDAIEMYHSGNEKFKKIALDAFGEIELNYNFRLVKTLEDACNALDLDYKCVVKEADSIANFSKSSAAMFKLNIVKKALNLNQDLHLTKDPKNHIFIVLSIHLCQRVLHIMRVRLTQVKWR